ARNSTGERLRPSSACLLVESNDQEQINRSRPTCIVQGWIPVDPLKSLRSPAPQAATAAYTEVPRRRKRTEHGLSAVLQLVCPAAQQACPLGTFEHPLTQTPLSSPYQFGTKERNDS